MGFLIINVVTNVTFPIDLPEADLILLSLDGDRERHNTIRGNTYDTILHNISNATADNICFYMAINQINKDYVDHVCRLARDTEHVKAVSFNFHTPCPDTKELALSKEGKAKCCKTIKKICRTRTVKYVRNNRITTGHVQNIQYITSFTILAKPPQTAKVLWRFFTSISKIII